MEPFVRAVPSLDAYGKQPSHRDSVKQTAQYLTVHTPLVSPSRLWDDRTAHKKSGTSPPGSKKGARRPVNGNPKPQSRLVQTLKCSLQMKSASFSFRSTRLLQSFPWLQRRRYKRLSFIYKFSQTPKRRRRSLRSHASNAYTLRTNDQPCISREAKHSSI